MRIERDERVAVGAHDARGDQLASPLLEFHASEDLLALEEREPKGQIRVVDVELRFRPRLSRDEHRPAPFARADQARETARFEC